MSLVDIKSKIEADAVREAATHRRNTQEQIDNISREASRQIDQMRKEFTARLENERREVHRRRKIVAELDIRKEDLAARRKLIDETFGKALDILVDTSPARYIASMEKLLEEAIETGDEILILGREEKVLTKSWLEAFNKKHKTRLTVLDEKISIRGGFILRKGRVDTNCSWEILLDSLRNELESEVVKRLFTE
ncbi:MAG: V-type ATP synthase subunit E family protein [Thermovirga sp.]